jgi:hypothetical protein
MKYIRPRFSIRGLAILVALVCCYFGLWEATRWYGVVAVPGGVSSPAPFVVRQEGYRITGAPGVRPTGRLYVSRYVLWLFGPMYEL